MLVVLQDSVALLVLEALLASEALLDLVESLELVLKIPKDSRLLGVRE